MAFSTTTKRILFALLVAAWVLPGVVARTPWKADEAYTYGLVLHMMETGDWVVPQLGGEPFMQKPPVFFIMAAICGSLFKGVLGLDTAIRLAVVIFQVITLVFLGIGARELVGPGKGWLAAVLFMGCVGFVQLNHMLLTDIAQVTGIAMAFAGFAFAARRPVLAGIMLGTGGGIAFMSKGLLGPGLIGLTGILLPVFFRNWRAKGYWLCLGVSLVASLPWVLVWPVALYQRSPELFNQWFLDNNLGRFLGPKMVGRPNNLGLDDSRYNFFFALPWYVWPAFPFICMVFWKERLKALREPVVQLGSIALLVMLAVLSYSRNSRTLYGLPLLVPACLLGAWGIALATAAWSDRARFASAVAFGLVATAAWGIWLVMLAGPAGWWEALHHKVPDYQPAFQFWAFLAALVATGIWGWWMWRQPRGDNRTMAINWCAGLALGNLIFMTLFLPLAESNMSYAHLATLRAAVQVKVNGRVMSEGLGEPQRAMLHYYGGLKTIRLEVEPQAKCNWLMTQTDIREPHGSDLKGAPWELVWENLHSHKELFRLYRRNPAGATMMARLP